MHISIRAVIIAALLGCATEAEAGVYGDELGKCLVDSSSPKDRAALVQWMFVGLSQNPAVQSMSVPSVQQREETSRAMAKVFNRLVLNDCRKEALVALKYEGDDGFKSSFETFGQVAATTLMSDPAASAELDRFTSYIDSSAFESLMKEAGKPVQKQK